MNIDMGVPPGTVSAALRLDGDFVGAIRVDSGPVRRREIASQSRLPILNNHTNMQSNAALPMKIRLTLSSLLAAVAFCAAAPAVHAQIKVATVDMNKVFSGYYKTKDAENKINDAREVAKKELDERMESHKQMLDEINQLNKDIDNPALSATAKSDRSKKREDKIAQVRQLEQEIQEFKTSREKQLQEQAVRMRNQIVEEIMKVITDRVKDEQYDVVLDKSGQSLNGVQFVLYSQDKMDFSDEVITALNKNRPTATAPAASPSASRSPRP